MTQLSYSMRTSRHSQYKGHCHHNYRNRQNRSDRKIDRRRTQHKCRWKLICNFHCTTQLSCWTHTLQHAACMGYCCHRHLCFGPESELQRTQRTYHFCGIIDNLAHTKQLSSKTRKSLHSTDMLIRCCDMYLGLQQIHSTFYYLHTDHRKKLSCFF